MRVWCLWVEGQPSLHRPQSQGHIHRGPYAQRTGPPLGHGARCPEDKRATPWAPLTNRAGNLDATLLPALVLLPPSFSWTQCIVCYPSPYFISPIKEFLNGDISWTSRQMKLIHMRILSKS